MHVSSFCVQTPLTIHAKSRVFVLLRPLFSRSLCSHNQRGLSPRTFSLLTKFVFLLSMFPKLLFRPVFIIFFTSSRHDSFNLTFLLSSDTVVSDRGHFIPRSSSCSPKELPRPLQAFQLTCLTSVILLHYFGSNSFWRMLPRCLRLGHVPLK